jgi:hypothetical protein
MNALFLKFNIFLRTSLTIPSAPHDVNGEFPILETKLRYMPTRKAVMGWGVRRELERRKNGRKKCMVYQPNPSFDVKAREE